MRIGELARHSGVPTKTIRYYEDIGLMPPPARTSAGYRDYEPDAADRLAFIRAAQSVGLTLGEIREVLGFRERDETPCAYVIALIEKHAADLSRQIRALEALRRDLEHLAKNARSATPKDAQAATFCHIIEPGSHSS